MALESRGGAGGVHESCLDCQAEPEDRDIKKGPSVTGRLPKQMYAVSLALKHLCCVTATCCEYSECIFANFVSRECPLRPRKMRKMPRSEGILPLQQVGLVAETGVKSGIKNLYSVRVACCHTVLRQHLAIKGSWGMLHTGFVTHKASLFFCIFFSPAVLVAVHSLNWNFCHTAN